jgi:small subunit ribosomal protein S20
MANIQSQKKRNRQNEKRRMRNTTVRSELKTRMNQTEQASESGSDDAAELYRIAQTKIDKAVTKGVLHPKTAARRKSRLAKKLNS